VSHLAAKPNFKRYEPMATACENKTMQELVDILAQKTQIFTQMLVDKKFDDEYKKCKEDIQKILAEIELRKESSQTDPGSQA
jgi:hypothetical protein